MTHRRIQDKCRRIGGGGGGAPGMTHALAPLRSGIGTDHAAMSAFYGEDQVRRVREAVDIVQLVGEFTTVRKAGANFTCCCLFHSERTPSMYLYPHGNDYHCFGCQAHGDVISLVMEKDRLTFVEALESLARRAGITLVPKDGAADHAKERGERERQLKAVEFATAFYEEQLWSPVGAAALAYLRGRGLSDACLREFRLGWAPGGSALVEAVRQRRADARVLVTLDLAVERDGYLRDRFYERITFPICDRLGNPVAFSARLLPEAERRAKEEGRGVGKYINNTDTPLYHKGRIVFNLHRARTQVRERKRLIVMEGPTDVMAAWQAGERACVAVMGTALTSDHAKALGQAASGASLIILLDGDRAGQANSIKAAKTFLAAGISARIAMLPDEMDPSELLNEEVGGQAGLARFDAVLADAADDLTHVLRSVAKMPHAMPREALLAAARDIAAAIALMPDAQARKLAKQEAETWLQTDLAIAVSTPTAAPAASGTALPSPQADALLHVLIVHPELRGVAADTHGVEPSWWEGPWQALATALLCDAEATAMTLRDVPEASDPVIRQRIGWYQATALGARTPPVDDPVTALQTLARQLHSLVLTQRLAAAKAELRHFETARSDPARIRQLADEVVELGRQLRDLR